MKNNLSVILYADDDEDDKLLMKEAVDELEPNYILIMVDNGQMAVEKLEELTDKQMLPCMIALDGNMPVMTGKEAVEQIRNNPYWNNIPICIFSTSASQWFDDIADKYGVKVYRKPTSIKGYTKVVRELLDQCAR
jgi:CheY-like chemotaxis protein